MIGDYERGRAIGGYVLSHLPMPSSEGNRIMTGYMQSLERGMGIGRMLIERAQTALSEMAQEHKADIEHWEMPQNPESHKRLRHIFEELGRKVEQTPEGPVYKKKFFFRKEGGK